MAGNREMEGTLAVDLDTGVLTITLKDGSTIDTSTHEIKFRVVARKLSAE